MRKTSRSTLRFSRASEWDVPKVGVELVTLPDANSAIFLVCFCSFLVDRFHCELYFVLVLFSMTLHLCGPHGRLLL